MGGFYPALGFVTIEPTQEFLVGLRFTGTPRTNFRMKFFRSNPLSRAHLLTPIFLMLFFTSSLATTSAVLPYSAVNSATLFPFAICFLPHIKKVSRNYVSTLEYPSRRCWRAIFLALIVDNLGWIFHSRPAQPSENVQAGVLLTAWRLRIEKNTKPEEGDEEEGCFAKLAFLLCLPPLCPPHSLGCRDFPTVGW